MMHVAFVHPRPVAIVERFNARWTAHRVVEPQTASVPHLKVQGS